MTNNEDIFVKNKLLRELQALTTVTADGTLKKKRSDSGKHHQYPSTTKSKERSNLSTATSIFNRVRSRLLNRLNTSKDSPLFVETDTETGFYLVIKAVNIQITSTNSQVIDGRKIEHTTKTKKIQKAIDLEGYRFRAFQENAIPVVITSSNINDFIVKEAISILSTRYDTQRLVIREKILNANPQFTFETLANEVYRVNNIKEWSWDMYRKYLSLVPPNVLQDDNFIFVKGCEPTGYFADKQKELLAQDEEAEKNRRKAQWSAHWGRR